MMKTMRSGEGVGQINEVELFTTDGLSPESMRPMPGGSRGRAIGWPSQRTGIGWQSLLRLSAAAYRAL